MYRRKYLTYAVAVSLAIFWYSGLEVRSEIEEPPLVEDGIGTGHRTETDTTDALQDAEKVSQTKEYKFRGGAEKYEFQAEVNRLMDILINSLYSNKDIFLRELISNASDALDKLRLLLLTDKSQLGDTKELEIKISLDPEKKLLKIRDTGIGMTKKDLISNLGTIAKSGTSAFLETLQKGGDVNLIGQFGVGFYSIYLVADYVEVISKHNDDKQWLWESKADGNFAISEDTDGEPLGRGTQINIYLKEETQEYAAETKLKDLVAKYSEFINFPIYLWESKEVDVPADEEDEPSDADSDSDEDSASEDGIEDEAEEGEEAKEEKPKTVKKTVWDWELLNDNKPIWLRQPSEVSEEEYTKFYKAIAKTTSAPLAHVHFKGEGDVEFRSVLFIPSESPPGLMDNYYGQKSGLDLYVRRVFITNELEELIPRYLGFLKGVVDSDTLPLSVSREALQEHVALKVIKKKVIRKTLDLLRQLAEAEKKGPESAEEEVAAMPVAKEYGTFWKAFGKMLKLGVIEDGSNRQRLAKLLRFNSNKSPRKLTSFEEYIERMPSAQKHIYFLTGESQDELSRSPFLEKLFDRNYEVIYFTDPVDEYVMQHLTEFDDRKLMNAAKENLQLGEKDDKEKKKEKALREAFKGVVAWWRTLLGPEVSAVKVSRRLAASPAVVVVGRHGWSANLERIMRAQAVADARDPAASRAEKILEINPRHPLIQELKAKARPPGWPAPCTAAGKGGLPGCQAVSGVQFEADKESEAAKGMARIIFDTALLESGYPIENPKDFNQRIYGLLAKSLSIKADVIKGAEFDKSLDQDEDAEEDAEPSAPQESEQESNEEFISRIVKEHEQREAEKEEL